MLFLNMHFQFALIYVIILLVMNMSEKSKRDYSTQNRSGQVVGVRLLMLYQFMRANASKTRAVTRQEIEEHLTPKDFKPSAVRRILTFWHWKHISAWNWNMTRTKRDIS